MGDQESVKLGRKLVPAIRALFADGPLTFQQVMEHLERLPRRARRADSATRVRCRTHGRARAARAGDSALDPEARGGVRGDRRAGGRRHAARTRPELLRRYFGAFGPASRADFAVSSGMRVSHFAEAFEALEPLRRFRDGTAGADLLDLPARAASRRRTHLAAHFPPKFGQRAAGGSPTGRRVLPEEYRKTVITKNGDVAQTFLVDGVVAGRWRARERQESGARALRAPPPRRAPGAR